MKPRIFVSSTFYDLKFIREDLSTFIKAHDFEPIMFEDGDIGYTPGKELDHSCYDTMKSADMVLLIIGGEYGSAASGEKVDKFEEYISITRNEFRAAVNAGIPIYIFVESNVYAEYGVYEVNQQTIEEKGIAIEFKATKNINVFRFIKEIRALNNKPVQEFRRSTDIKSFLSKQWSDMFKNYLALLRTNEENVSLQNTVSDMESLIKQMSIMLDAVGKKVIGGEDQNQYDDILKQQNEVEARRICRMFWNGIKLVVPDYNDRKTNIIKLLDSVKATATDSILNRTNDDHETGESTDLLADILISNLHKKELSFARIASAFVNDIPEIADALNIPEIEKEVIRILLSLPSYRRIFEIDSHEIRRMPSGE